MPSGLTATVGLRIVVTEIVEMVSKDSSRGRLRV